VARLTTNKEHTDLTQRGDRTLMTFIGRGTYVFATYNGDTVSTSKEIEYGEQLDGHWNYVFFCYKRKAQRAIAYVLFSLTKEIKV